MFCFSLPVQSRVRSRVHLSSEDEWTFFLQRSLRETHSLVLKYRFSSFLLICHMTILDILSRSTWNYENGIQIISSFIFQIPKTNVFSYLTRSLRETHSLVPNRFLSLLLICLQTKLERELEYNPHWMGTRPVHNFFGHHPLHIIFKSFSLHCLYP